ncbi:MAG: hypothetical protein DI616_19235 [Paracoccus denitrificans]|uniref:Uncharacterized protein n=1 Tax=Paracoccus denitrificans TaxID=266 RepID=A0A533HZP5_PARDE|nr:MAG: hypothetical protein DI616_19235 [Paracoccus denitrificans]
MAIGMAVKKGSFIYVYNEKNRQIFIKSGDLHGYTSSTVTVKNGAFLYTYNEKGQQVGVTSAR